MAPDWSVEMLVLSSEETEEEDSEEVAAEAELLFEIISSFDFARPAGAAALVAASQISLGLSA